MPQILVNYISPVILLVISLIMLLNDISFYADKNHKKVIAKNNIWLFLPALKLLLLLSIAYLFFSLDPQFLKPTDELLDVLGHANSNTMDSLEVYNKQWSHIIVLGFIFLITFVIDIIHRLRVIQLYHESHLNDFIKDVKDLEALTKLNKLQSEEKK